MADAAAPAVTPAADAAAAAPPASDKKVITKSQLDEHTTNGDLWLLIHGKVYDVSKFMDEHPGGDEVLLSESGKDATESFEDVGHSDDARSLLTPMLVGEIEGGAAAPPKANTPGGATVTTASNSNPLFMFIPLIFIGAFFAYKYAL